MAVYLPYTTVVFIITLLSIPKTGPMKSPYETKSVKAKVSNPVC